MFISNVKSIIYYEHQPNEYVMEHFHKCYECVFYLEGSGEITLSNEMHAYDGPTITIVGPRYKHDETVKSFSRLYIVLFELNEKNIFKPFNILSLSEEDKEQFLKIFKLIIEEYEKKDDNYQSIINSYFNIILTNFLRLNPKNEKQISHKDLITSVKNYLKENYMLDIDFKVLASVYGYSYDRFRHIFSEKTNASLNQYLLNCRLYAAKHLLLTTNLSVKQIAIETGFKSNVYFNNFFTSKMNISPRKFRSQRDNQIDVGVFKI